jgi:hypothetical protein
MTVKVPKSAAAVTLIEVMVTMVILTIAIMGSLNYEYYAARDVQISQAQITASRTAQLLLEDWKSTGGSEEYDPSILGLGFSPPISIPFSFTYDQGLGSPLNDAIYTITVNNIPMLVMLLWKDIAYDSTAEIKLRQLAVIVECGEASENNTTYNWMEHIEPVELVTYTRVDASGG